MSPAFTPHAQVRALLAVEVALAEAQAAAGVIPADSAAAIRRAADPAAFDPAELAAEAAAAGNLAIPLVARLAGRVGVLSPDAAGHVHVGATSQDALDTALVLQIRDACRDIDGALDDAAAALAVLARTHAATPMAGRTWLQQASPITFGLKAAGWLDAVERSRERLAAAVDEASVIQLGGPVGTRAALGGDADVVTRSFAEKLGLGVPVKPWHADRQRIAGVGTALGLMCGTLAKVARDVTLLAQTEIGEVSERPAPGRGRSSSMPHKRNPVHAVAVLAAATPTPGLVAAVLASMPHEHERAAGGWQAEWRTLPALVDHAADAARAAAAMAASLEVYPVRMRANLGAQGGVALAEALAARLVPEVGRLAAMELVTRACDRALAGDRPLADAALDEPGIAALLDRPAIDHALDPTRAADAGRPLVEAVLAAWRR